MMNKRFIKDISHPIDELKRLRYQLIEDIKYWDELKIENKVKFLTAQLNDYDKAIEILEKAVMK